MIVSRSAHRPPSIAPRVVPVRLVTDRLPDASVRSHTPRDLRHRPWLALGRPDMVELRRPRIGEIRRIPAGTTLCLVLDAPGSRRRLRRLARRAGLEVDRELLVLPSTASPVVVLDDSAAPVGQLWQQVATVPPGVVHGWLPATVALQVLRRLPWQWTGAVVPGRVVIARKP